MLCAYREYDSPEHVEVREQAGADVEFAEQLKAIAAARDGDSDEHERVHPATRTLYGRMRYQTMVKMMTRACTEWSTRTSYLRLNCRLLPVAAVHHEENNNQNQAQQSDEQPSQEQRLRMLKRERFHHLYFILIYSGII